MKIRVLRLLHVLGLVIRALRLRLVPGLVIRALVPGPVIRALRLRLAPGLVIRALRLLLAPGLQSRALRLPLVPGLQIRALMLLLVPVLIAAAQSPIGYPRVGCFQDEEGSLRPVLGIAGTFVLGDAEQAGVVAAACRGKLTLVKTEDTLELRDRDSGAALKWPAPEGPALFAFPADGSAPLAFFPATSEWLRAAEGMSSRALPAIEGELLAISSSDGKRAAIVVRREAGLYFVKVSLEWGYVIEETELTGVRAPVFLTRDGALLAADGGDLVVRAPGQEERRIALPAPAAAIGHLGEGWTRVALEGGGHMALRMLQGGEELYRLPEAAQ